jgi:AcrR family transcriptional regulator
MAGSPQIVAKEPCQADSPTPPVRRRGRPSPDQTRQRQHAVIAAARYEFIEKGYRATAMQAIAARAGVSKRSLYLWHADKAALFRACIADGVEQLDLPSLDRETDLERGLSLFAAALLSALSAEPAFGMGALLMHEGRDFPELSRAVEQGHARMLAPLVAFLDRHGAQDGARLAHLFESVLLSDLQQRMVLGQPAPSPQEATVSVQDAVRLFVHGLSGWPMRPG